MQRYTALAGATLLAIAATANATPADAPVAVQGVQQGEPLMKSVMSDPLPPRDHINREVPASPATVVADAVVVINDALAISDGSISVPDFKLDLPEGTLFQALSADGDRIYCQYHGAGVFKPAEDGAGAIYPKICFMKADGSGRYSSLRFYPYDPDRAEIHDVAIRSVRLRPAHTLPTDALAMRVMRQIVVKSVDANGIILAVMQHLEIPTPQQTPNEFEVSSAHLSLTVGAETELAGVKLRVGRDGPTWTILASGSFAPWVKLSPDGTFVTTDGRPKPNS